MSDATGALVMLAVLYVACPLLSRALGLPMPWQIGGRRWLAAVADRLCNRGD